MGKLMHLPNNCSCLSTNSLKYYVYTGISNYKLMRVINHFMLHPSSPFSPFSPIFSLFFLSSMVYPVWSIHVYGLHEQGVRRVLRGWSARRRVASMPGTRRLCLPRRVPVGPE